MDSIFISFIIRKIMTNLKVIVFAFCNLEKSILIKYVVVCQDVSDIWEFIFTLFFM